MLGSAILATKTVATAYTRACALNAICWGEKECQDKGQTGPGDSGRDKRGRFAGGNGVGNI